MAKPRDYAAEYKKYQGTPAQLKADAYIRKEWLEV